MKKIIIIVLLVVLVAGIGTVAFLKFKKPGLAIEEVLPKGAIVYVQLSDIEDNVKKISATPFWQNMQKINYQRLIDESSLTAEQKAFIGNLKAQFTGPEAGIAYKKFFSKDLAFAVYPPGQDFGELASVKQMTPEVMEKVLNSIVIVTRVNKDVQAAEFASRFVSNYGKSASVRQEKYNEETVQIATVSDIGLEVGFVRLNDLIILGVGDKAVKESIDVFHKTKPALKDDQKFGKVKSKALDSPGILAFWDMENFFGALAKQVKSLAEASGENNDEFNKQMDEFYKSISGFKAAGISTHSGVISKVKFDLYFNVSEMDPRMAGYYAECAPKDNPTIKFIPKDVIAYQWNNCLDLDQYWEQLQEEMKGENSEQAAMQISTMEQTLGLSIEQDILPAFGDEIGGYLSDIQAGGMFPLPKLALFIKVDNEDKAKAILAKLMENPFAPPQEESYSGRTIKYLALPLGDMLQPSYTFLDEYLLLTMNRAMMKSSIDALNDKSLSLLENAGFKEIDLGLTGKNTSVQFVKVDEFFSKLEGVVEWGNDWVGSKDASRDAFKAGAEKKLLDAQGQIYSLQQEIIGLNEQLPAMDDAIWNAGSKGEDTTEMKKSLAVLKDDITRKEGEIASSEEQVAQLKEIMKGYDANRVDPQQRRRVIDEVVYPLFNAFKTIKSMGGRSTMAEGAFESTLFIKL